jgi:class 3 adenylate cyclase
VNLAARLEQLNRELGTEILVSAEVAARVRGRFILKPAGSTMLKGFAEPIQVFALLAASEPAALGPPAEQVVLPAPGAGPQRSGVPVARPR